MHLVFFGHLLSFGLLIKFPSSPLSLLRGEGEGEGTRFELRAVKPKVIFRIIFFIWVTIWLLFFVRGLVKGEMRDYINLFGKTLEEKQAYVTGKEFYEFIIFCKKVIPENSDYTVEANYDQTLDYFRFAYYMYPSLRNLYNPEYIACYKVKFLKKNYKVIASLSNDKYILKRCKE